MKKIIPLLTIATTFLTSCGSDFKSQSEYADEYMESIVQCLDNNDADELRKLFSADTRSVNHKLDEEIVAMLDFYEGTSKYYKSTNSVAGGESFRDGEVVEQHIGNAKYELTSDKQTYTISFAAVTVDTETPQLVGLNRIWLGTDDDNYVIVDSELGE